MMVQIIDLREQLQLQCLAGQLSLYHEEQRKEAIGYMTRQVREAVGKLLSYSTNSMTS